MKTYQKAFIQLALEASVLKFGEFTLKSGRVSPYFFNAGKFNSGASLAKLGQFYAHALIDSGAPYDMLFGPAYKGIPLVSATSIALSEHHDIDVPYGYNRKEAKAHGEGGVLVGAKLTGNIAIIDDVITAGTAIREVLAIISRHNASPAAVVVGLDRQEKGQGHLSAIGELQQETGIPVISIVTLNDIVSFLSEHNSGTDNHQAVLAYRDRYGVAL